VKPCGRCNRPLEEDRRWGYCETCRRLCPRCHKPNGRASSVGYCPDCQRQQRDAAAATPRSFSRRQHGQSVLAPGQRWFPNQTAEQRLPIQQITLDVERTAHVLRTFYNAEEFERLMICLHTKEE
jgi:hypothetical protein